ncbi:MAG: hypothetical protein HQ538_00295 [Parcubacteria group bacterium]|nr:hypothetical protein [Parcubacteria group bacterium]
MEQIDIIKRAIMLKKSIRFVYDGPHKIKGERIGDPHALYIENNTGNVLLDLFQTDGYSESAENGRKDLPSWNRFNVKYIYNIEVLEGHQNFDIASGYNPYSDRYYNNIFLA